MSVSAQEKSKSSSDSRSDGVVAALDRIVQRTLDRNIPGLAEIPFTETELEIGTSEKELIYSKGTARLYHYAALTDEVYRKPMLLVMSPVARGYILDLTKGQSFVEYFLRQGHDVYMVDWAPPRKEHKDLGLASYVCDMLGDCVDHVVTDSGEDEITLVGYCMGGMLSIIYAALNPDSPVKNLACFTTPVNSDGMEMMKKWMTSKNFDIDRLVEELGNIPADMVNASLAALRPLQRSANNLQLLNNVEDDAFVKAHLRFDRWAFDQLPFAGQMAKDFANDFYIGNKLVKNTLEVRGKHADFSKITIPFLHVAASFDHIVPPAASKDLIDMVSSEDKQEIVVRGGHVSLVAGGNAIFRLWPQLDQWLSIRAG